MSTPNPHNPPPAPQVTKQSGFSLTEIMIALTLGLIVIAGLGQIYVAGRSANRIIDNNSFLNENGRFAIEYLARAIRIAGYYRRGGPQANLLNVVRNNDNYFWFADTDGAETYAPDDLPSGFTSLVTATPKIGTDILVLRGAVVTARAFIGEGDINNTQQTISFSEPHSFKMGDVVVINTENGAQTTIFQVTGATNTSGAYNISFANNGSVTPGNCTTALAGSGDCTKLKHPEDLTLTQQTAELNPYVTQAYFIADDPGGCRHKSSASCDALTDCPTLFTAGTGTGFDSSGTLKLVPILRNVTDLQIESRSTESGYDDTIDWSTDLSLRLTLEISSDIGNVTTDSEGQATITCGSQEFQTTVYLRNAPNGVEQEPISD